MPQLLEMQQAMRASLIEAKMGPSPRCLPKASAQTGSTSTAIRS